MPFDFFAPIENDTILVARWSFNETDSDNDDLYDVLESYIGTDPMSSDTDGDGVSDGIETMSLQTNPLLNDTDGDEEMDNTDDADTDGLTNEYEIQFGTNPINADSDGDGLSY